MKLHHLFVRLSAPLTALSLSLISWPAYADRAGNGTGLHSLEGFENFRAESKSLRQAITEAEKLIESLNLDTGQSLPELKYLGEEIEFSKYILVPQDILVAPNRAPGDYPVGSYLVASTNSQRGAPTKIYPKLFGMLSSTQIQQMVIHEALHRALPEPMNAYEPVVERLTSILTQYAAGQVPSASRDYLDEVKKRRIPWTVAFLTYVSVPEHVYAGTDSEWRERLLTSRQKAIQPLLDEEVIVESTSNNTRVRIRFDCKTVGLVSDGIDGKAALNVYVDDQYRGLTYSFRAEAMGGAKNTFASAEQAATAFIRKSLRRIQNDLQQ